MLRSLNQSVVYLLAAYCLTLVAAGQPVDLSRMTWLCVNVAAAALGALALVNFVESVRELRSARGYA